MNDLSFDVLVIGGGAAGMSLALRVADHCRVGLLSKESLMEASTFYAQGGISAVLDKTDTLESHVQDTLEAGAGLCDPEIVRFTVEHGPELIHWLIDLGVPFTRTEGNQDEVGYHLTREGGHSHRRVVHADDATGQAMMLTLETKVRTHANIHVLEKQVAVDLILSSDSSNPSRSRCVGAYVMDRDSRRIRPIRAKFVVLATGGASRVYPYTSNPDVATGDGIAMAWRAGCRVANMEFMQFHPTCLYHPGARSSAARSFLISEAVRGEGGRLLLPDGTPFMHRYDPRGELAPRDIVAHAIDHEMKRLGVDHVYLDISHKPADFIRKHFPTIHNRCLELGYDMTTGPLPVVPAAHYTCGGIVTDKQGHTDLTNLYAIGETAYTGLHGANRMASNSLLECLVFAASAAQDVLGRQSNTPTPQGLRDWDESRVTDSDEDVVVSHNWDELRRFMWDYVGIVRSSKRLQRAQHRVDLLRSEISEYYGNFRLTVDLLELRNLALVADLIIRCALGRRESRGLHYTIDHPDRNDSQWARPSMLVPENFAGGRGKIHWDE